MEAVSTELLASGGNRCPTSADSHPSTGLVAYGTGSNVALWSSQDPSSRGLIAILAGFETEVQCVRFLETSAGSIYLIASAKERNVRSWKIQASSDGQYTVQPSSTCEIHHQHLTTMSICLGDNLVVTGSLDSQIQVWRVNETADNQIDIQVLHRMELGQTGFIPLASAICALGAADSYLIATAGTADRIILFTLSTSQPETGLVKAATLAGHEGWIRSLDFIRESSDPKSDILLASASQDKYIRLWRIHSGSPASGSSSLPSDPALGITTSTLTNKVYQFSSPDGVSQSATFEALLVGHEDWIFTARWDRARTNERSQLLSASADNSVGVWERDDQSGIWVCAARLGEIAVQKGATTATGSAGGFWIGLWMSDRQAVGCLGATGNWRLWKWNDDEADYYQVPATGGHVQEVCDIAWSRQGTYLLSVSADQTTRLWAEWHRDGARSWHEFARPQIHGYDLNCIAAVTDRRFVSGADEKLLRVFDEPSGSGASIPVLGLSNKGISTSGQADHSTSSFASAGPPPVEDQLSRTSLWPELEKLYGHGFEISAVAASHDGAVVATACKATSMDHAVVRLFDSTTWHELRPGLAAHSHTVRALAFSPDDRFLLSVGRDRQWVLWARNPAETEPAYSLFSQKTAAHTRMILAAAWAPLDPARPDLAGPSWFVTAGRDKRIAVWRADGQPNADPIGCFTAAGPVMALSVLGQTVKYDGRDAFVIAYGLEDGSVDIIYATVSSDCDSRVDLASPDESLTLPYQPSKAVAQLAWRPHPPEAGGSHTRPPSTHWLAVASDDCAVRIYRIGLGDEFSHRG